MYKRISNVLANYIIKSGVADKQYYEVYKYGFECMVSVITNIIFLLIVGKMIGNISGMIIYIVFFSFLRNHSGGMHCQTHMGCIALYTIVALMHMWIIKNIYMRNVMLCTMVLVMYCIISIYLVFKYAPVDSINKRLSYGDKLHQKNKSRIIVLVECGLIIVMALLGYRWISIVASAAMVTQSISLIPILNDI
jgi:accessory gene regulator B